VIALARLDGGPDFLLLRKRQSFVSRLELISVALATYAYIDLSLIILIKLEAVVLKSTPSLLKVFIASVPLDTLGILSKYGRGSMRMSIVISSHVECRVEEPAANSVDALGEYISP
jgi:hypothetical protein